MTRFFDFKKIAKYAYAYGVRAGQAEALKRWVVLNYGDGRDQTFYDNISMMVEIELQMLEEANPFAD